MKKILICSLLAIILSNCEIRVQQSKAEMTNIICNTQMNECITADIRYYDGMKYLIFSTTRYDAMSPFAINLTKDSLEVELLKKQLK